MNELDNELRNIVRKYANIEIKSKDIKDDTRLVEDLKYTSIKLVELIVWIELHFCIDGGLEDTNLEHTYNYSTLYNYIESSIKANLQGGI